MLVTGGFSALHAAAVHLILAVDIGTRWDNPLLFVLQYRNSQYTAGGYRWLQAHSTISPEILHLKLYFLVIVIQEFILENVEMEGAT